MKNKDFIKKCIIGILICLFIPLNLNWIKFCIVKLYDADDASNSNLYYELISESNVMVTGYKSLDSKVKKDNLVIKGKVLIGFKIFNVTDIGSHAFNYLNFLEKVELGKGIKNIGDNAFYGCINLSTFHICGDLETIGDNAFYGCINLSTFHICGDLETIGDNAFYECDKLRNFSIGKVKNIGNKAFYKCNSLSFYSGFKGVCNIGDEAFGFCESLQCVFLPTSVNYIGANPFVGCSKLTSISVYDYNLNYRSINGVLYNKTMDELKCFPSGLNIADYVFPSTVKTIGKKAFSHSRNSDIFYIIPSHIEFIDDYAFEDCFCHIIIENSSNNVYVGKGAFKNCTTVYFAKD